VLHSLRAALSEVIAAERLPPTFVLEPGVRLRSAYGRCRWSSDGPARISVRCTSDQDRCRWRTEGAIVATLLHELTHLRYRGHGPRFWALHRRLVDRAAGIGVYSPGDHDPAERGRGDEKLAGSAAQALAVQARATRRARWQADRAAVRAWQVGALARLVEGRGRLRGAVVRVLALGRTRLVVEMADGRRYRVPPRLLEPLGAALDGRGRPPVPVQVRP
jgi:hypothetical protein